MDWVRGLNPKRFHSGTGSTLPKPATDDGPWLVGCTCPHHITEHDETGCWGFHASCKCKGRLIASVDLEEALAIRGCHCKCESLQEMLTCDCNCHIPAGESIDKKDDEQAIRDLEQAELERKARIQAAQTSIQIYGRM